MLSHDMDMAIFNLLPTTGLKSFYARGVRWIAEHGVFNVELVRTTRFGFKIEADKIDVLKWYVYFFDVFEPTISKAWKNLLRQGDVVIDVGGNVGYHALLASTCVGASGKVISFEPSPDTFVQFTRNRQLNNAENIDARQMAVSDRIGSVRLHLAEKGSQGQSSIVLSEGKPESVEVQCLPLAEALDPSLLERIALIKIDVEGAESLVIEGLLPIVDRLPEKCVLFIEVTPTDGKTTAEIIAPLVAKGFKPHIIENGYSLQFYLRDPRPVLVPYDGRTAPMLDLVLSRDPALPERCLGQL